QFPNLQVIDLGGGFKVPYKPEEEGTPMHELGKALVKAFQKVDTTYGKQFEVWFEPGKFMVSEAGYLLTEVNVIKETNHVTFVGVNSGFNHLIRPMFYDAYHGIVNLSNPNGDPHKYTVVGNICETDTFATDRALPEVKEGDLLAFLNAGAYGFEMSSNFNSRYKPAEVLILKDQLHLIRKRDTWEDLIKQQIQVIE
ncbi:MAG: diaminopimelate decarboxylase, partial [Sediminibacterium sp.]|nr:diaminopimelate decarboxylase [Sediminibacterium sp.]